MLFHSCRPIPALSDFVENLWLYKGFASPRLKERIFPSGTFELVINLRDDELRIYQAAHPGECRRFSGAIVSGPYNEFFMTDTADEACVMGIHFKPGGAFPFLGLHADELAGTHMDLETIWGSGANEIRERLAATESPKRRFRLLEKALLSRLLRPLEHHPAVSFALEGFRLENARAVVRKLARNVGLSDRRFIDVFRSEVGLKPKIFNRVQRFQRVLARAHQSPAPDWAQVAQDHGYFDQSHLIRDFLAFSGFSPTGYLRRLNDLRKQGLHVKFNHLPTIE
ncbi:MAG TPA: AraC family transcriptional regulator [Candidatus Acidoferrales bacterium]|nr:AraC family transcriptional regulator [Candidatus Acidoferrales bacterium]